MPPKGGGGKHWKEFEVNYLLNFVENKLPLGNNEWTEVTTLYNVERLKSFKNFPERDLESCRNKFKSLKKMS